MTVSSTTRQAGPFAGDGTTNLPFAFTFKCFSTLDLYVTVLGTDSIERVLTLDTDYTAVLHVDQGINPGGTVTLTTALADGASLIIASRMQLVQPVGLATAGAFYPETIELALDRAILICQDLQAQLDRTIQVSMFTPGASPSDVVAAVQASAAAAADSLSACISASYSAAANATNASGYATAAAASAAAAAASTVLRNLLYNGSMAVDQRNNGAAHTFTAGVTYMYGLDRWQGKAANGGADVTGQRVADTVYGYAYQLTGVGSAADCTVRQLIDVASCPNANQTVGISFAISCTVAKTVQVTISAPASADAFSGTLNTIVSYTVNVTTGLACNTANFTMPSTVTGLVVSIQAATLGTASLKIAGVQLERGLSTAYESVPYAVELARCQRYFLRYTGVVGSAYSHTAGTNKHCATLTYPQAMRAAPTITFANSTYTGSSTLALLSGTNTSAALQLQVTSADTTGQVTTDVLLSAEL